MASILVIDDDRAVLATIKVLLERAAHAVEAVDNSRDGLQLIETRSFDLLIVDIFMPGMDGFETMRLVHQSRPDMPVIVISGQQFSFASDQPPVQGTGWMDGLAGYGYIFTPGATMNANKVKVFQQGSAAGACPKLAAGAYPAAITSDTVTFYGIFKKLQ